MKAGRRDKQEVKRELSPGAMSVSRLCGKLGKSQPYVRTIQSRLGLHIPADGSGYSEAYGAFLETVIVLRTFSVPLDEIGELFESEKKILRLLKIDTLTASPTWYLDACGKASGNGNRLLLTNHDLTGCITPDGVQFHLDFSGRLPELFSGPEMGEDAHRLMDAYLVKVDRIKARVRAEESVIERALRWFARTWGEAAEAKPES